MIMKDEIKHFLEYEIAGSRWASFISWDWVQEIAGRYYAKKVTRKYHAYKKYLSLRYPSA